MATTSLQPGAAPANADVRSAQNVLSFPCRPANNNHSPQPPSPADKMALATGALARLTNLLEARPYEDGDLKMVKPACELGCRTCFMECAILPDRISWWQGELNRLQLAGRAAR